jgi:hypothetical protein
MIRARGSFPFMARKVALIPVLALCVLLTARDRGSALPSDDAPGPKISQKASDSCARKVKALDAWAARPNRRGRQTTRLSEEEINSYLALELKAKFHPCLTSLQFVLGEKHLSGAAGIDFDKLGMSASKTITKMLAHLFSGKHKLSVAGILITEGGKGNFQLEEARFDGSLLPNFMVSEIITAVGRKQRPPFDPLQPSQMPYAIEKVEVHRGYIVIYQ